VSTVAPTRSPRKRRTRFRFTLNGLAIQLSAFALSFTLVALLVVSGSQAAFVEESETLENYVPIGAPAPDTAGRAPGSRAPARPATSAPPVSDSAIVPESTSEPPPEPTPPALRKPAPPAEVRLTDSAAGTALFGDETLSPGTAVERCISVTYTGNVDPEPVQLYAAPTAGHLAPYLDLTIELGRAADDAAAGCAGFATSSTVYDGTLAGFAAAHSSYATGRSTWDPEDGEETRSFRFTLALRDDPAASGKSVTFGFSWRTEAS
jgi:hypothetical protein